MSNIYVEDVGKGFPFVFVHGYLGSSKMWNFQKEFFSKHYRVIIPALPGFGESHNVKSLDSIDYNSPSMDKDSDFVDPSGQTLQEYEGSLPEFTNMGGIMRTEGYTKGGWSPNAQSPGAKGSSGFTGTAEQNIESVSTYNT